MKKKSMKEVGISNFLKVLRIMKLNVFLLLVFALQSWAATSYSQQNRLTLNLQNVKVLDVLNHIEEESNYYFLFNRDLIDVDRIVSISADQEQIQKVLENLFSVTNVKFVISDRQIVLTTENVNNQQNDESKNVTGKIVDSSGSPLPGVTVMLKGTNKGTVSDTDGNYSIKNIPYKGVLVFSFMGMKTMEIPVKDKTTINVTMVEDAIGIEEVVAVGYGTQRKVNLTGAVGIASSERLENRTITAIGQGLQGVIPGLNITYDSGDPNESADFNIRGYESINGGSPLILVDGVPMDAEKVNTNDIKSVSVLKDASSAAIYGARAAFGVILIETKKGKIGKTNISFSAQMTLQKAIYHGYDPVREEGTVRQVYNEAFKTTRGTYLWAQEIVDAALAYQEMDSPTEQDAWYYYGGYLYPLRNYYMKDEAMTDFSPQKQYDFSISGASEKASYYVSLGVIDKEGFFKYGNENYNRYNVLSKVDFNVTDWLTLEEKVSFASVVNNDPHSYGRDWFYNSLVRHSWAPIAFPDLEYYVEPGDREKYENMIGMYIDYMNPLPYLKYGGRDISTENDIWLTQGVSIKPLKGLSIKGDFSYRYYWADSEKVQSKVDVLRGSHRGFQISDNMIYNGASASDYIENSFAKNTYYVFNAYAVYNGDFGDHSLDFTGGFNQEYGKNHGIKTKSTQLLSPNIHSLGAATGTKTNDDEKNEIMLRGIFYRLKYSYKDKYLFEANGRYDGTSRFPRKDRFGFFPSFSLGWRLSEESFMEGTRNWLDNLKIRASYGQLGNQGITKDKEQLYYPYISSMSTGTSNFLLNGGGNLTNYISPGGLVSSTLTWETVTSKNIGLDFTLLKGKLDVELNYFIRDTKDMLMTKEYPNVLGASAPRENAADLRNTGWELALTLQDKIGNDLSYRLNLTLSDYQTEITKYNNPTGAIGDYYVGQKIGEIWGFETVGLFQTEEELANAADQSRLGSNWRLGDVHYANLDDDDVITTGSKTLDDHGDLKIIGNSTPRYTFGINPSIKYKNFTLDVFAQGILKRQVYPSTDNLLRFFPFFSMSMEHYWIDDSWSPDNRDAYFPGIQAAYYDHKNVRTQTRYLQNAAYIRLKNVTLSYDIPVKFVAKAQVYLNGTNLWEASGMYKTLDPEQNKDLQARYFFHRSFTLGLKVTL